jgi:hypothetical protein
MNTDNMSPELRLLCETYVPADPIDATPFLKDDLQWIPFITVLLNGGREDLAREFVALAEKENENFKAWCVEYSYQALQNPKTTEFFGGRELLLTRLFTLKDWSEVRTVEEIARLLTEDELDSLVNDPQFEWNDNMRIGIRKMDYAHGWFTKEGSASNDPLSFAEVAAWSDELCLLVAAAVDRDNMEDVAPHWLLMLQCLTPEPGQDPEQKASRPTIVLLREICLRRLQEAVRRDSPFK